MSVQTFKIKLRLAESTRRKAEKLGIDKLENNLWLVQGSKDYYEVEFKEPDIFVCHNQNGEKELCKGWRYSEGTGNQKQCKHILAVVLKSEEFELE